MSLDRGMGAGVIGAEVMCEHCSNYIDMNYVYRAHCWEGTCHQCRYNYVVDLEVIIRISRQGAYVDWDEELRNL